MRERLSIDGMRARSMKRGMGSALALLATLVVLPVACGTSTGRSGDAVRVSGSPGGALRPEESRVLGVFPDSGHHGVEAVTAPSVVKAGAPFVVTVTTTGSGCERVGDVGVLLGDRHATLMVYDFTSANRPGVPCTGMMNVMKHDVPITLSQAGGAVISVWGRRQRPSSPPYGEPDVIERRVTVR